MNKTILQMLLAVATLAACSQEEGSTPAVTRPMTVRVTETPMVTEQAQARQTSTRGTVITGTTLSAFSMNYQNSKYDFSKSGEVWTELTWPSGAGNNDKLAFYAYNGGTFNWNGGSPYVNFACEAEGANQKDLLVATRTISYNEKSGVVPLTFDHACAAVTFYIKKKDGISNTFNVQSVVLSGVKDQGNYSYASGWTNLSGSVSDTLNNAVMTDISTSSTGFSCGTLFLIPQSKSGLDVTVKYTAGSSSEQKKKVFNLSGTWAAGTSYSVTIQMGSSF